MTDQNIRIHAEIAAKLNFAAHQSTFPLLRALQVENLHPEERMEGLVLKLQANPAFVSEKVWPVDRIAPQGSVPITNRDLEVDSGFLLNLTESLRGIVTFRLEKDGELLAELTKPVELLAYNEWGGAGFMPELLAAFSMPNDPAVDRILRNASEVLRRAGKEDRIDGYESRSRQRVWEIASAIYTAIANLGLTYAVPPASFETDGQKIRLPSQIFDGKVGTCLDTAMLFASTFEQAGLNPIIALPKGHALVGVWLQPEDLSAIVIDEAETLRKRIDLQELVLIETTYVTSHPAPLFSKACNAAKDAILPEKDATFAAAVDIRRARAHSITPLGLRAEEHPPSDESPAAEVELPLEEAPALPGFDSADLEEEKPETPESRLQRWQRRLLDLTLNNRLLNHRATKTSLRIICPQPGRLEDKLAEGARIQIRAVPKPSVEGQDEEIHRQRTGEVITEEYALDELDKRRVLVDLPADQLDKRAVEIYRKAQTALQEGGANTLYLAIGFLLWKRDRQDQRRFRAPLILLPVALERKSVRSGIRMVAHDDEPRFNTTLLEMLRKDFRIDIQNLDGELPTDKSGIDVNGIWNKVRRAVKEAAGFEVVEDVVLGHFSFAKYLMWKDLVDRTDALRDNAVVRHLIDTPHDPYVTEIDFVEPRQLDREYEPSDLLTPLPADSSQMAALATADRGKDFVMIGPPGTGKSQSISNLIAHLLGKKKTVLFVSEKTAALEVVYRRLDKIGLSRFCLELHSNKARKADVLNQLRSSWDAASLKSDDEWEKRAKELRTLRDRLNRVVDKLHKKHRNGLTVYYAMGVKVRDEEFANRVTLRWPRTDHHDEAALQVMRDAVENLSIQAKAIGDISASPFHLVTNSNWTPQWEADVAGKANALSEAASDTDRACETLCEATGVTLPDCSMKRLDALDEIAKLLVVSYRKPTASVLESDGPDRIEALKNAAVQRYAEAQTSLSFLHEPQTVVAWQRETNELRALCDQLNRVVTRLNKEHPNGLTARYAMDVKIHEKELASRVSLSWPTADHHDQTAIESIRNAVENLQIQAKAIGHIGRNPFHLVKNCEWSPQWESRIVELAERLVAAVKNVERACETLCEAVSIPLPDRSIARLDALGEMASLLVDSYRKPTAYALESDGLDRLEALKNAAGPLKAYAEAQASLSCAYEPFAWRTLDGEDIGWRWKAATATWWPKRFFMQRSIIKEMRAGGAQGQPNPERDAQALIQLRQEGEAIDSLDRLLAGLKGWTGHATDPSVAESLHQLGKQARSATSKLADDPQTLAEVRAKARTLLHDGNDLLAPGGVVERAATAFLTSLEHLHESRNEFETSAGDTLRDAFAAADHDLAQLGETAKVIVLRRDEIRDWCAWWKCRAEAVDLDLLPLVEAMEQGRVPAEEMEKTFEAAYCTWWLGAVTAEDEVLRTFSLPEQEATIAKFHKIDHRLQELTAEYIAVTIAGLLTDDPQMLAEVRTKVRTLLHDGNDLLAPGAPVARTSTAFLASLGHLREASTEFEAVSGGSVKEAFATSDRALTQLREAADAIAARHNELRDWCAWLKRRAEAVDADLLPFVEAVEQGRVPPKEMEKTFEAAYCTWWSGSVIGEDEVLRTFSTPEHEATIANFRRIDDRFQKLTGEYIAAILAGSLPEQNDIKKSSQWGVLRHELQKKRRHKPVRKLLEEAPEVMTSLAPCFMMSPLSVAQYLSPNQALFDVVIFDEASQITVWDAVGSIARGQQVIVTGDPKQMPPTNFFARSDDDPDGDIDAEGDLESILDEMLGAGIPRRTLNLHYRSRKESLIAFSNARYYDNELITFPAPNVAERGVRLVRPDGFYARGKARHNEGEAKAIVNEVLRRLTHPDPAIYKLSIGVVTFNSEQQNLIENLLDEARSKQPEIEWAFSREHTIEPVFVKNLETVQGDERDVILFSVTYGPDQSGHVTMNFGPLNREGGERRLNVAMTRSRSEMLVFSTLSPEHIDLSRTQARAVADLKHFLEYAENGQSALGAAVFGSVGDFESPFEAAVARELRMKGWQVHPQVGVSAYRIDLGVVHPDQSGRYLAGIECDGAMYHSSAFARERDKIRQQVLEGLGWTLFRLWSTDWWTNKAGALEKVHSALHRHLEDDRRHQAERASIAAPATEEASDKNQSELPPDIPGSEVGSSLATDEDGEKKTGDDDRKESEAGGERELELVQRAIRPPSTSSTGRNRYVVARFDKPGLEPDPEAFYSYAYERRLSAMLDHVIDIEGPIHEDVLVRRIARHHGFQRAGRQIRDVVLNLVKRQRDKTREKSGFSFWPEGTVKDRIVPARYEDRDAELLKIEYICAEELRAINDTLSLGGDAVAVSRALGIARLSQSARDRIENAIGQEMLFRTSVR